VLPEEVALSILAEVVQLRRARIAQAAEEAAASGRAAGDAGEARDPVCGMTVEIATARHTAVHLGRTYYFCALRCREAFAGAPARHLAGFPAGPATEGAAPAAAEALDPVCGMTVAPASAAAQAEHRGQAFYFCHAGCRDAFVADPARYLDPLSAAKAAVDGGRPAPEQARDPVCGMSVAVATAAARAEHRGEPFYFCHAGCRDAFAADPARYLDPPPATEPAGEGAPAAAAEALDPVCGMAVAVASAAAKAEHRGETFFFCHAGCRDAFAADPARYLEPRAAPGALAR
jgi:P-type Cu+ transporter